MTFLILSMIYFELRSWMGPSMGLAEGQIVFLIWERFLFSGHIHSAASECAIQTRESEFGYGWNVRRAETGFSLVVQSGQSSKGIFL